jgi:hypothetical protein
MKTYKKIVFLIVINSALSSALFAQKRIDFSSAFKAGLLNGEADKAGTELQLVGGISYKSWFSGIGSGVEYYSGFKSIPVYVEVRKDLKEGRNTPFVNADMGYNWPLRNKNYKMNYGLTYKFRGGLYYELSAGYKFILSKSLSMALSAGYSYKNFKEVDSAYYGVGPFDQPLPPRVDEYDYKFRRISVKVAFWF